MKNRMTKIMLTLLMLLVMAVPTQVFAAESNESCPTDINGNNFTEIYNQFMKQFDGSNLTGKLNQQPPQAAQPAKAPAAPAKAPAAPTAAPAAPAAETAKPAAPAANTTTAAPASANYGSYEQQVVNLVNQERAAAGLPALKVNTELAAMAEKKAEDLRDNHYFDHTSPVYGSPFDMMRQFGISYTAAGENIAKGQRTPAEVMNGWMNSPGHRANILNSSFTEIGVGYVTDSSGTGYWVQEFIRP